MTSSRSTTGLLASDLVVGPVANLPNGFESRFTSFFPLLFFSSFFFRRYDVGDNRFGIYDPFTRLSVDFIIDFDDQFFMIIVKIDFPFLAAVYKAFFSRIL